MRGFLITITGRIHDGCGLMCYVSPNVPAVNAGFSLYYSVLSVKFIRIRHRLHRLKDF